MGLVKTYHNAHSCLMSNCNCLQTCQCSAATSNQLPHRLVQFFGAIFVTFQMLNARTNAPPPPCISYANVHKYYGPYAYCSLSCIVVPDTINNGGRTQCKRSATIWVCGRTRDPYLVILGGHHCCFRVGFDASSTLGIWHFWIFTQLHPFPPFFTLFCSFPPHPLFSRLISPHHGTQRRQR